MLDKNKTLDDYVLRQDADLVKLSKDMRKFLKNKFPEISFQES